MASSRLSASPSKSSDGDATGNELQQDCDAESLLDLLGDEYTQRILSTIGDDARTGRELIERADVSKATAYRRLDDLRDAGIVESTMRIDPDGHHCEQYQLAVGELTISFSSSGFEVTAESAESSNPSQRAVQLVAPGDD